MAHILRLHEATNIIMGRRYSIRHTFPLFDSNASSYTYFPYYPLLRFPFILCHLGYYAFFILPYLLFWWILKTCFHLKLSYPLFFSFLALFPSLVFLFFSFNYSSCTSFFLLFLFNSAFYFPFVSSLISPLSLPLTLLFYFFLLNLQLTILIAIPLVFLSNFLLPSFEFFLLFFCQCFLMSSFESFLLLFSQYFLLPSFEFFLLFSS